MVQYLHILASVPAWHFIRMWITSDEVHKSEKIIELKVMCIKHEVSYSRTLMAWTQRECQSMFDLLVVRGNEVT
jgi:hypothetical protein